jgi:CRP/FNR family cyclic AMP-dependent transcriptional regulator
MRQETVPLFRRVLVAKRHRGGLPAATLLNLWADAIPLPRPASLRRDHAGIKWRQRLPDRDGTVLGRTPGVKKVAIRAAPDGGTFEEDVEGELVENLCLDDDLLAQLNVLAGQCEQVFGPARDIEWALAKGQIYLLQCRAVTRAGSPARSTVAQGAKRPVDLIERVPLFANMSPRDTEGIAALFKERRFAPGETITKEGTGAAAFFVIESGEASVSARGQQRATLSAGDYFGEIALIDEGARSATVSADTELVCYGLTYWEFRPLVQQNATIAWNLLHTLARRLRIAQDDESEPG